jgi:pimeloyl-ACP methyl ester carboxylesterase
MQQRRAPVILILGTMGSRLVYAGPTTVRAWVPTRPTSVYADAAYLQCDEDGVAQFPLDVAGCLDRRPLDFVSPLRNRLGQDAFAVLPFPYDWRQSLFRSAELFADWVDAQHLETFDIVGVSTGGLIATQYARMGFGARIRKFISIGTPFLGMPRSLANIHTGAVLNRLADVFLAHKVRSLIRTFPSTYELLPCQSYFDATDHACAEAHGQPLRSHSEMCSFVESHCQISSRLLKAGAEFLLQLDPAEALRNVDTSYIVNSHRPTPSCISYGKSGKVHVTRRSFGDGSAPATSQTIGGQHEVVHPGHSYEFQGRHRTMHMNPLVMEQLASILLDAAPADSKLRVPRVSTPRRSGGS